MNITKSPTELAAERPHATLDVLPADGPVPQHADRRALIVLPAYNEEESLPPLLDAIERTLSAARVNYHVLVVDDGSGDGTARVASQASFRMPLTLVRHEQNRGLAAALRSGLEAAVRASGAEDVIFTLDADNTQPPGLMPRMMSMVAEGHDVVIASRFQPGSRVVGVPWNRNLMSLAARGLFSVALPIRGVRDYTCGYRAYRATALRDAINKYGNDFVTETGFSCMVDVLLKLRGQGLVMGEAPMILRYDQKGGASKMRVVRTALQTLSLITRRRLGLMGGRGQTVSLTSSQAGGQQ